MGVATGVVAKNFVQAHDEVRILKADKISNEVSEEQRVARRNARLEKNEAYEETEGIIYRAGIAD